MENRPWGFAHRKRQLSKNQHSPIADWEHPYALSIAIPGVGKLLIRLIAKGFSELAVGKG